MSVYFFTGGVEGFTLSHCSLLFNFAQLCSVVFYRAFLWRVNYGQKMAIFGSIF